ncbi:hypothetical protein MMC22_009598 [Lobaria immixta]|nr:hypothetical protein [Lobaria immixta]
MSIPLVENEQIELPSREPQAAQAAPEPAPPPAADFSFDAALKSACVRVIDWQRTDQELPPLIVNTSHGLRTYTHPIERVFSDLDSLRDYLEKTRLQCSLGNRLFEIDDGPENPHHVFKNWIAQDALQKTANLTCFAWNRMIDKNGHNRNRQESVKFSFDYLTAHKRDPGNPDSCSKEKHAFTLEVQDGLSNGAHTVYNVSHRISVFCLKGRRVDDFFDANPNDPPNLILLCEASSHDRTLLRLSTESITAYDSRSRMEYIGHETTKLYLNSMFRHLADQWTNLLEIAISHNRHLEDDIYMQPDSDSPARKLWMASKNWLTVERLLHAHTRVIREVEGSVIGILRNGPQQYPDLHRQIHATSPFSLQWNFPVLERWSNLVQDDLLKPTANLLDMMYKSVAIRDARLSLNLNASLWRLSWITFIFLPLTFLSEFFGMNVDWFSHDPSIKWYGGLNSTAPDWRLSC